MAQDLACRLLINGVLVTKSPLHVGGMGDDVSTDMPLARNGLGQVCLPGTSLAGAFRSWLEQAFGPDLVEKFAGFQTDQDGRASSWIVEDAVLSPDYQALVEVRQGVGINRLLGSAHPGALYDRAVVPRGARLPLEMSVEVPDENHLAIARAILGHLLDALKKGRVPLGAARSRGLGRIRLVGRPLILEQDFRTSRGMLQALCEIARERGEDDLPDLGGPTQLNIEELKQAELIPKPHPRLEIEIAWKPSGALMVKADQEGLVADAMPSVSHISRNTLAPLLPGSSIKGVLRACAERILRTLLPMKPIELPGSQAGRFQNDLEVPLVTALFGAAGKSRRSNRVGNGRNGRPEPGLAALWVDDCHAEPLFEDQWDAITSAESPGMLISSLESACLRNWNPAYHVAVDRWTGGAADRALFCTLEPWQARWEPIRLTLDLERLRTPEIGPALALLCLVLRELARGRLPLGFAANRGMGDLEVEFVSVQGRDLSDRFASVASFRRTGAQVAAVDLPEIRKVLERKWKRWVSRQRQALQRIEPMSSGDER